MDIFQEAFEFAKKIQKTEQYLNFKKAKEINDKDEQLQDLINEFNMLKLKLKYSLNKINSDEKLKNNNNNKFCKDETEKNSKKLAELYDKIMENRNMSAFNEASNEINNLMNKINKILIKAVNSGNFKNFNELDLEENSEGCTGNCHGCSECF